MKTSQKDIRLSLVDLMEKLNRYITHSMRHYFCNEKILIASLTQFLQLTQHPKIDKIPQFVRRLANINLMKRVACLSKEEITHDRFLLLKLQ